MATLAYVGLPIVLSAYGDTGFTRAGLLMGCLVPIINLWSIVVHIIPQRHQHPTFHWKLVRDQLLYNPLIIGAMAGILWNLTGLAMPGIARNTPAHGYRGDPSAGAAYNRWSFFPPAITGRFTKSRACFAIQAGPSFRY